MFARGGFDARAPESRRRGSGKADGPLVSPGRDQPGKALVMTYISQLVADGHAHYRMLDDGEAEVRFASGEVYLLGNATILRLA